MAVSGIHNSATWDRLNSAPTTDQRDHLVGHREGVVDGHGGDSDRQLTQGQETTKGKDQTPEDLARAEQGQALPEERQLIGGGMITRVGTTRVSWWG